MSEDAFKEFQWRGLLFDSSEGAADVLAREKITAYNGFDPTADSLHVGHLVPMMGLARLQRFGHTPIALAGGGTGMIGDPSGRATERQLLTVAEIDSNVAKIETQLAAILDFDVKTNPARVVNNADWLRSLGLMDFLRDVGKHFTVNYMLAKESVKSRIEREDGISFTEFSYMLLQSYDFLHLFDNENCVMQAGGSDQWGNIVAGVQLVRKVRGKHAYAISYPLITKADGSKFGKSAGGSVWLDPAQTSPYRFYQFWLNTVDDNVLDYLRFFTWLERSTIEALAAELADRPEGRAAQKRLATEMTAMIHGPTALARAQQASTVLFGGDLDGLDAAEIADIFADVPSSEVARTELGGDGLGIDELLARSGLERSRGAAQRAISGGGVYLNNRRVEARQAVLTSDCLEGQFLVLRKGKRRYHLVKVVG